MEGYIESFKSYLETEKHSSQNTVSAYVRDLRLFSNYLENYTSVVLENVTESDLQNYTDWMRTNNKSLASVTRTVATMKAFYTYLMRIGVCETNPAKLVEVEKAEKKLRES